VGRGVSWVRAMRRPSWSTRGGCCGGRRIARSAIARRGGRREAMVAAWRGVGGSAGACCRSSRRWPGCCPRVGCGGAPRWPSRRARRPRRCCGPCSSRRPRVGRGWASSGVRSGAGRRRRGRDAAGSPGVGACSRPELMAVTSALLDGLDVVVTTVARPVPAGERQRLAARARQRGAVLCVLGSWPGADVQLSCTGARWAGGAGLHGGSGRLGQRQVEVGCWGGGWPGGSGGAAAVPRSPAAIPAAVPAAVARRRWVPRRWPSRRWTRRRPPPSSKPRLAVAAPVRLAG
jgi:hypothetical protein